MERLNKKTISDEVYEELRTACLNGKWKAKLPGARTLGASLGVSPPTVLKAMAVLATEGILLRTGNNKAYQVNTQFSKHHQNHANSRGKSILILTPSLMEELNQTTSRVVKRLKSSLTDQGWKMKELVIDYINAKKPHDSWDRMIDIDVNTPIIAVNGTPAIADWAARHNMRILFIGGLLGGRNGTVIAVSSTTIAIKAIESLIALGHRRIILPLNGRPEELKASLKSALKSRIESLGEVYQTSYHNPESPYFSREIVRDTMMMYAKSTLPTAIIFLDWRELLAAYCYLSELGMKVPKDVSLILLNDQSEAEWFSPELTRFTFPLDGFVKALKKWLTEPNPQSQEVLLQPTLIKGASIAPSSK